MLTQTMDIPGKIVDWWIGELTQISYHIEKCYGEFVNSQNEHCEIEFTFYDLFKNSTLDELDYGYIGSKLIIYAYVVQLHNNKKIFFDVSFESTFRGNIKINKGV